MAFVKTLFVVMSANTIEWSIQYREKFPAKWVSNWIEAARSIAACVPNTNSIRALDWLS